MSATSLFRSLVLTAATLAPDAGLTRNDPSVQCLEAARVAARQTGVPYEVLLAISVVETGRAHQPWPWTVNLGGDGRWLDSAEEAEALVSQALDSGTTNIDLGCFQLNYRWHAEAFGSIDEMLDPEANALYAAGFLERKYSETGDWALAAGAYHSGTPEYANRYRSRFEAVYAALSEGRPPSAEDPPLPDRVNRFPLLVAGLKGSHGSLVPGNAAGSRLIGGP